MMWSIGLYLSVSCLQFLRLLIHKTKNGFKDFPLQNTKWIYFIQEKFLYPICCFRKWSAASSTLYIVILTEMDRGTLKKNNRKQKDFFFNFFSVYLSVCRHIFVHIFLWKYWTDLLKNFTNCFVLTLLNY